MDNIPYNLELQLTQIPYISSVLESISYPLANWSKPDQTNSRSSTENENVVEVNPIKFKNTLEFQNVIVNYIEDAMKRFLDIPVQI